MTNNTALKDFVDFVRTYPTHKFEQGQAVLFQGEVPTHVYVIKSGAIKAYNIDQQGEEKIIALVGQNEIVAPSWAFNKASIALYYYDAFVDTEAYVLSREELQHILTSNGDALFAAFSKFVSAFIGANIHINALENSRSTQKIIHLLEYLTMRFGVTTKTGKTVIKLRLTQQDIARMLGVTRETVATELSKLKKQQLLSYRSQQYTIDLEKIRKLNGEEEFTTASI